MTFENDGEESKKIFVGGLSWKTSEDGLATYFRKFGEVVDSIIMKNKETNRPRGFGFVQFDSSDAVSSVISACPHYLDGKAIDAKACRPRSENIGSKKQQQVFLGGLAPFTTEIEIRNAFSEYGKVVNVNIMYDKEKGRSKGYGFLTFESDDSVKEVCDQQFVMVNGHEVQCKLASQDRGSFGYSGRRGRQQQHYMQNNRQGMSWYSSEGQKYPKFPFPNAQASGAPPVGFGNNWGTAVQQPYAPSILGSYNNAATYSPTGSGYDMAYAQQGAASGASDPAYQNAPVYSTYSYGDYSQVPCYNTEASMAGSGNESTYAYGGMPGYGPVGSVANPASKPCYQTGYHPYKR